MKKIEKPNWEKIDEYEFIAELCQLQRQYNNDYLRLVNDADKPYLIECISEERTLYALGPDDITDVTIPNAVEFLRACAANLCDTIIDRIRWHFDDATDYVVAADYDESVSIIIMRNCNNHWPVNYACDDHTGYPIIFSAIADAQAWIDAQQADTYCLAHNEYGRPDYYIVPAYYI